MAGMKQKYIEALQWLFGEEWGVRERPGGLFEIAENCTGAMREIIHSGLAEDDAYICHLIDEALLNHKDLAVIGVSETKTIDQSTYTLYVHKSKWPHDDPPDGEGDPLTARLEAIAKLKENHGNKN